MPQTADNTPDTTEADAARAVLEGTWLDRLRLATRAAKKLARDPEDTKQVFLLGLLLNLRRFPEFLARIAATPEGLRLLTERPSIDSEHVDFAALRALPEGSLGREYVRYLDDNKLDPDVFQSPPGLPEIPAFVAQRMRQSHDIWHVLTGYKTDIPGEVALLAFTYGQTRMPSAAAIVAIGTLRHGLFYPHMMRQAARGFERGKQAEFLAKVAWEDQWHRPLEAVRSELGISAA